MAVISSRGKTYLVDPNFVVLRLRRASSISSGLPGYHVVRISFDLGVNRCVISSAVRSTSGKPSSAAAVASNNRS